MLRLLSQFFLKGLGKENLRKGNTGFGQDKRNWVILDAKYIRRLEKFSGDSAKYRGWVFDLVMVLNQIDPSLANEVNRVMETCGNEGENGTIRAGWTMIFGRNIILSCMQ